MVRQRLYMFAAAALTVASLPSRPLAAGQAAWPLPMLSAEDPYTAFADFQLADEALERREYTIAEPLLERAIARLDDLYGPEHAYAGMARARLAVVYQRRGQRIKAEAVIQQASAVIEKTLGTDTRWFAQCLVTQGTLREEAGDSQKAEEIDLRALAILERIGATRSVQYASLLNNLGMLAGKQKNAARAEELFRRALALDVELDGPDSLSVAIQYQNLGVLARERGDYESARDLYTRALAIRERRLGANHQDVAQLLNNLANIHYAQGDVAASLEMHFRALRIQEQAYGAWHGATLVSVGNIARRYAAGGDLANAITWQRRADAVIERQLELQLAVGSERQKLAFVNSVAERTERTVSLHLREAPADAGAASLAALVLLQRKGRVLDAMAETYAAARTRGMAEGDRTLLDRLDKTTAELARLALNAPGASRGDQADERQQRIKELEAEKERLEAELSAHSAQFRARRQPTTLDAVQAALPDDAALVEFAVFRPFDPKAERNADAYGVPHYAAYVLRRGALPRGFDLGPAAVIDAAADALRQGLRDRTRPDLTARARVLYDKVIGPLYAALGSGFGVSAKSGAGVPRLLISPDGALNLVPFEAMIDRDGRYLIERYAISYLTSGRDLLRMRVEREARGGPVIVADPLFGKRASGPSSMYFAPLSNTAAEAREIAKLFPEARLLTGAHATKTALATLDAPRLLHIASHGFFFRGGSASPASSSSGASPASLASTTSSVSPMSTAARDSRAMQATVNTENPLFRSGLALAGANEDAASGDSGILTAMEASGLDLWGTKLVTLSACDTGIGEVRNGEGVYGLRRAFVLAGAESLVMSLWPVSDYVTRQMMTAYYTGLRDGLGRGDALREAKLAMLRRTSATSGPRTASAHPQAAHPHSHPYFWASFIQSGEWSALGDTPHSPATSAH